MYVIARPRLGVYVTSRPPDVWGCTLSGYLKTPFRGVRYLKTPIRRWGCTLSQDPRPPPESRRSKDFQVFLSVLGSPFARLFAEEWGDALVLHEFVMFADDGENYIGRVFWIFQAVPFLLSCVRVQFAALAEDLVTAKALEPVSFADWWAEFANFDFLAFERLIALLVWRVFSSHLTVGLFVAGDAVFAAKMLHELRELIIHDTRKHHILQCLSEGSLRVLDRRCVVRSQEE